MSTNGSYQGAYNGGSAAIDITSEDLSFAETKFKHPEKSTAGTRYYKIAEQTCIGTYQRIDETFLVTSRSNAAILNIMLASSSTKQFISYRVAWLPVNYGAETALCNRFYFGLSGSGEGNTFQIWLSKNQWSESVAFHPIGNNAEGYKISTWTGTNTGDTNGQTTAPTFTTTIVASQQYMPRTGGTWTGPLFFNSDSLPSTSTLNYICGIDSFADGGDFKYTNANDLTVGKANTLTTARTINGTPFNGSANITTSNWGTARTLTIGNTGKSVNGSTNISWSLSEIGAAASSHTHSNYLTTSGTAAAATKLATARTIALSGDVTGSTSFNGTANVTIATTVANDSHSHSDSTITSVGAGKITGTLAIAHGGTGGTTAAAARGNLGAMGAVSANGYYGMTRPDGDTDDWIRTTTNGIIPYQSGGNGSLGTDTWFFSKAHIRSINLRNTLDATATSSSTSYSASLDFKDKNGIAMGDIQCSKQPSNKNAIQVEATRTIGSTTYYNSIRWMISNTGGLSYSLSSPAAFRNVLGLGNTSGALPVANGGTGATARGGAHTSSGLLYKIGLQAGTSSAPSSGNAGMVYIQYS